MAPLPGAESYCKDYQNKGHFPAMLLLSRLGRRCNKTQTLQRFLGTAQVVLVEVSAPWENWMGEALEEKLANYEMEGQLLPH